MSKRIALAVVAIVCVVACVIIFIADGKKEGGNIITLTMSEEAKQYEEESIKTDGVKDILSEDNFALTMAAAYVRGEQVLPECTVENKLEHSTFNGSNVYTLTPDGYDSVVLYIHGGAWSFEISQEHVEFCDKLATALNAKVYMPLYPLAPQANSKETYEMLVPFYEEVLKEGKDVYLMGDSAGGNLALGLMYTIKEEGLTKPTKMVLIAPCSDMTFSNDEMIELDKTDPELSYYGCSACAYVWAGGFNIETPKYSAVYADVTGYPDTIIFQGTNDILCPDNLILYNNMVNAGVNVTLVKGEGLWHVFPIYPIPERDTAINLITEFCVK